VELVRGYKLRDILLYNQNWWRFFLRYAPKIRQDILTNVIKIMACGSAFLGYRVYQCPDCDFTKACFLTCKSRFCASCGKKATENWIKKHLSILPQTTYQHITFTFPQELQALFWLNRHLINKIMPIPAEIITDYAAKLGAIPGIFVALHTFGRDLKRNMHFHLSTTLSGLSLDKQQWIPRLRFNRKALASIKLAWRNHIIALLRNELKAGNLVLPDNFGDQKNPRAFCHWLSAQTHKIWVVHFSKSSDNHYRIVIYLGRYLKRPPIGETRIKHFDGNFVTFSYFDHHSKSEHLMTLPVFDFIKRLITHIPDRYFRVVRYYNWLSNRTRSKYLPFIYQQLKQIVKNTVPLSWRELIIKTFGTDPLLCQRCKQAILILVDCVYTHRIKRLISKHQLVSNPDSYLTT